MEYVPANQIRLKKTTYFIVIVNNVSVCLSSVLSFAVFKNQNAVSNIVVQKSWYLFYEIPQMNSTFWLWKILLRYVCVWNQWRNILQRKINSSGYLIANDHKMIIKDAHTIHYTSHPSFLLHKKLKLDEILNTLQGIKEDPFRTPKHQRT